MALNLRNFPLDIARLICSFGYPEQTQYMKEIIFSIDTMSLLQYNIKLMYEDCFVFQRKSGYGILTFFEKAVKNEVLDDLFIQCSKCTCCTRHCHNRPINYKGDLSQTENYHTDCDCTCRHISRLIAKTKRIIKRENIIKRYNFNIQFIPLSTQIHLRRARFHQENEQVRS